MRSASRVDEAFCIRIFAAAENIEDICDLDKMQGSSRVLRLSGMLSTAGRISVFSSSSINLSIANLAYSNSPRALLSNAISVP